MTFRQLNPEIRAEFDAGMSKNAAKRAQKKAARKAAKAAKREEQATAKAKNSKAGAIMVFGAMKSVPIPWDLFTDEGRYDPKTADPMMSPKASGWPPSLPPPLAPCACSIQLAAGASPSPTIAGPTAHLVTAVPRLIGLANCVCCDWIRCRWSSSTSRTSTTPSPRTGTVHGRCAHTTAPR